MSFDKKLNLQVEFLRQIKYFTEVLLGGLSWWLMALKTRISALRVTSLCESQVSASGPYRRGPVCQIWNRFRAALGCQSIAQDINYYFKVHYIKCINSCINVSIRYYWIFIVSCALYLKCSLTFVIHWHQFQLSHRKLSLDVIINSNSAASNNYSEFVVMILSRWPSDLSLF